MLHLNRLTLFLLCLFVLTGTVAAQKGLEPQVDFATSLLWGTAYELVLRDGTYTDPVSRLRWPVSTALALDITVELPWANWTSTRVSLRSAWPLAPGTMIDEDWRIGTLKYGYSEHEAPLKSYLVATAEQRFSWGPFSLSAGGLYRWTSWEGWNGTGVYQSYSGTQDRLTFSGLMIAYRQQWIIPYLGASWAWEGRGWTATPSVRVGPYSWCFDMDNHNYAGQTTLTFLDNTRGGLYVQGGLEVVFPGGPAWNWGLRGAMEQSWGAIGETITTYSYQTVTTTPRRYISDSEAAGTWFHEGSVSLFLKS